MPLEHALRSLRRTPGFSVTVLLTLTVGLAAIGTMAALVRGVLLEPLPYVEPQQLVYLGLESADAGRIAQPPALQALYEEQSRSLDAVAIHRTGSTNVWTEGSGQFADSVIGTWVSASMLPLLGTQPQLGRNFTAEEELRGGPDSVILSDAEWRERFNASSEVIGKTLMVNSVARQVIGVMPASFAFPTAATRLWLPAKRTEDGTVGDLAYSAIARLAPSASVQQAQRELRDLLPQLAERYPRLVSGGATAAWLAEARPAPIVLPLHEVVTGDVASILWLLAGAAMLVLLVTWANAANLFLIRADGRQPENAVRAALGASRWRAASPLVSEATLLCVTAVVLAAVLTTVVVAAIVAFGPGNVPRLTDVGVDSQVLLFMLLIAALSAIACVALPAVQTWRARLTPALRDDGRSASAGRDRVRWRFAIVALQIAVALTVTIGSALLLQTARQLAEVDPGFNHERVTTLRLQLPYARYGEAAALAFYTQLAERVAGLPAVQHIGLTRKVPLQGGGAGEETFRVVGSDQSRSVPVNTADAGYFTTMAIPLLAGRGFDRIRAERSDELILSRRAAADLFDDPSGVLAIGRQLTLAAGGPTYTIIGIVGDIRDRDLASAPEALVYRPLSLSTDPTREPTTPRNMALVVKSHGAAGSLVTDIRRVAQEIDPTVPIYLAESMRDVVSASTARLAFVLATLGAAAAVTLLLSATGLYGALAYMVSLRRREFGIRAALGADPVRIARLVAIHGLQLTAAGLTAGLLLHRATAPWLQSLLFGVTINDPSILFAATSVLLATAALACWLPARRAAAVDPALALRAS